MHARYGMPFIVYIIMIVLAMVLTVAELCSLTVPQPCALLLK